MKKKKISNIAPAMDILYGYPFIQISNGKEMVIEGNCKLLEYTDSLICTVCKGKKITICGKCLEVRLMDSNALVVNGYFYSVSFGE